MTNTFLHLFKINFDFTAPANDAKDTISLTIPDTFTVPAGGEREFTAEFELGTRNAPMTHKMWTSKNPDIKAPVACLSIRCKATWPGEGGVLVDIYSSVIVSRSSPTTIRMSATFVNDRSEIMTCSNAVQTVYDRIRTFIDPVS